MRNPKVHRAIVYGHTVYRCFTKCGRFEIWPGPTTRKTWRGVTCKSCLRAKGKR